MHIANAVFIAKKVLAANKIIGIDCGEELIKKSVKPKTRKLFKLKKSINKKLNRSKKLLK